MMFHKSTFSVCLLMLMMLNNSCSCFNKKSEERWCYATNLHQRVERLSIKEISKIKAANGKFIAVDGFFNYSFEDVALYASKASEPNSGLCVNFTSFTNLDSLSVFNRRYVTLIGKINLSHKGHLGMYIASIDSVFLISAR